MTSSEPSAAGNKEKFCKVCGVSSLTARFYLAQNGSLRSRCVDCFLRINRTRETRESDKVYPEGATPFQRWQIDADRRSKRIEEMHRKRGL